MSLKDLKLNKQLNTAMEEAGFVEPTEMQSKAMSRILGRQDLLAIGPDGCGKSTTIVLSVIMQLKYAFEDVPRALILVPNKEKVDALVEEFNRFTTYTDLRVEGVHSGGNIQSQKDDLYIGVDVVVGTPDRVYALTLKYGLNLNGVSIFVLDDAEEIVKQGFQVPVRELADGLTKCQQLVFSTVYHKRMESVIEPYFNYPTKIEVFPEIEEKTYDVVDQEFYRLDNFQSKQNFLGHFINDKTFEKTIVFANTRLTAGNIYTNLEKHFKGQVCMYKALFHNQVNIDHLEDFIEDEELMVLLVANDGGEFKETSTVDAVIHFDLPENPEVVLERVVKGERDKQSVIFTTDLELPLLAKIESEIGAKVPESIVPDDYQVVKTAKKKKLIVEDDKGSAFHEKSAKNSQQVNWNSTDKIKKFGKVKKKGKDR